MKQENYRHICLCNSAFHNVRSTYRWEWIVKKKIKSSTPSNGWQRTIREKKVIKDYRPTAQNTQGNLLPHYILIWPMSAQLLATNQTERNDCYSIDVFICILIFPTLFRQQWTIALYPITPKTVNKPMNWRLFHTSCGPHRSTIDHN